MVYKPKLQELRELQLQGKHPFLNCSNKIKLLQLQWPAGTTIFAFFRVSFVNPPSQHKKKEKGLNWSLDYLNAVDQNHGPTVLYKHHRLGLGL